MIEVVDFMLLILILPLLALRAKERSSHQFPPLNLLAGATRLTIFENPKWFWWVPSRHKDQYHLVTKS